MDGQRVRKVDNAVKKADIVSNFFFATENAKECSGSFRIKMREDDRKRNFLFPSIPSLFLP